MCAIGHPGQRGIVVHQLDNVRGDPFFSQLVRQLCRDQYSHKLGVYVESVIHVPRGSSAW